MRVSMEFQKTILKLHVNCSAAKEKEIINMHAQV